MQALTTQKHEPLNMQPCKSYYDPSLLYKGMHQERVKLVLPGSKPTTPTILYVYCGSGIVCSRVTHPACSQLHTQQVTISFSIFSIFACSFLAQAKNV